MDGIKRLLSFCSMAAALIIVCYVAGLFWSLFDALRHKGPISKIKWNPIVMYKEALSSGNHFTANVVVLLLIIGISNRALFHFFGNTIIGSFFEKNNYDATYEATLFIDDKPIFCLVEMSKDSDPELGTSYRIFEVYLPYGKSQYTDAEYTPGHSNSCIYLGDWSYDCDIELTVPATATSFARLKNEVVSNYGEFCGSKESDKYHLLDCLHVKNILPKNLVYFETQKEADVLGYAMCSDCWDRY